MNSNDIIDNHYKLKELIGRGSFGEVWLATDTYLEQDVALKFYVAMDSNGCREFRDEYLKVYRLRHENLLTPSHYAVWNDQPYLELEYCPVSAAQLIGKVDEQTIWQFIADVSAGLACMHGSNPTLVHQDIKPANILRKTDGHFAITDFGISVSLRITMLRQSGREASSSIGGSIPYMGPELFGAKPVPIMASDVWALGVSIYELATGDLPFMAQGGIMLKNGADMADLGDLWSAQLNHLLKKCLALNTWERPMASNIHEYATAILNNAQPCELIEGNNQSPSPAYVPTRRESPMQPFESQFPNLKLNTDIDCEIVVDGDLRGEIHVGQIKKLPLRQGDYILQFVSLNNPADTYSVNFTMPNADKIFEIQLKAIQTERENEESRQRAIELELERNRLEAEKKKKEFEQIAHKMVFVEGGTFWMGATKSLLAKTDLSKWAPGLEDSNYDERANSNESPVHKVSVDSFYIGKFPVTQWQWKVVMGENPSEFSLGDNYPVERVTWNDCQEFIRRLNDKTGLHFRLPTEAEWEYAARGGNQSKGHKYAGSNDIYDVAWFDSDSNSTHIVGTKQPNELGIYDMSGNVFEWCQDWYGDYNSDSLINPKGAPTGMCRVLRGGSWKESKTSCRVTYRHYCNPNYGLNVFGLRLVCTDI